MIATPATKSNHIGIDFSEIAGMSDYALKASATPTYIGVMI
jgi:hypothetical protein